MNYTNEEITERRDAEQPDARQVQTYRQYAAGEHPDILSNAQRKLLGARATHKMVANYLDLVLQATASRLRLKAWKVQSESPISIIDGSAISDAEATRVTSWLNQTWLMNRMPRLQFEVHYAQLRDSDSAVSMAYRGGRVHLWREPWWDGDTGVFIAYNDAGEYEFAVKEWVQRERDGKEITRRTVYEPGLLTRWVQNGSGWQEYSRDNEPATVEMVRPDGRPLPIPFVHFPNGTNVAEGYYGQSDIAPLLALQDEANAGQLDLTASALLSAFQRMFMAGVPSNTKIQMEPGGVFGTDNDAAKLTVVPAGDLSQIMEAHSFKRDTISLLSRTPNHVISGQWPSGAALLRADMPIIEKVEALADVNGPQWTMVPHRAMELANAFNPALQLDENVPIMSEFAPAERIDELTELEIKQARATLWDTLSRMPREAMVQAGVDETTADQIVQEREAMTAAYMRDFNAGAFGQDYTEGETA